MKKTLILLGLALTLLSFKSDNLIRIVDTFKIDKTKVEVYFFDPSYNIIDKYPDFNSLSEQDKNKKWNEYLHNSVLYMFVKKMDNKDKVYFLICGNPEITNSKMFYKVQIVKGVSSNNFNPNKEDYKNNVVSEIKQINCSGALFEHMDIFKDKNELVGNGIKYFGTFKRIQPYSEIKESMIEILEKN